MKKKTIKHKTINRKSNWDRFIKWTNRIATGFFEWIEKSYQYILAHWPRYLLSLLTGTFTWQAAYIITGEVYYAVMAVLLAEGMFLYWLSRFDAYENITQKAIVIAMFVSSCIAIFLTDIASAFLIVNENDKEKFIQAMPGWVVWVITNSTPYLSASNLVAYGLFEFFSDTARDKREDAERRRNIERVTKASKRDVIKLRSRGKVLRILRTQEKVQAKHTKSFGSHLVEKVDGMMKLELMQDVTEQSNWFVNFIEWIKSLRKDDKNVPKK